MAGVQNSVSTISTPSSASTISAALVSGGVLLPADASAVSSQQAQKRPMNAFLIFCKRHRSVVRQKYPHLENRSITKILGEWWAALDAEEKHNYTDLARQYKEAFMKANPHFKWYKTTELRPPPPPPSQTTSSATSSQSSALPVSSTASADKTALLSGKAPLIVGPSSVVAFPLFVSPPASANASPQHPSTMAGNLVGSAASPTSTSSSSSSSVGNGNVSNNNNSTPKLPPKKRYLESLESSGGDYTKSKLRLYLLDFKILMFVICQQPNQVSLQAPQHYHHHASLAVLLARIINTQHYSQPPPPQPLPPQTGPVQYFSVRLLIRQTVEIILPAAPPTPSTNF